MAVPFGTWVAGDREGREAFLGVDNSLPSDLDWMIQEGPLWGGTELCLHDLSTFLE